MLVDFLNGLVLSIISIQLIIIVVATVRHKQISWVSHLLVAVAIIASLINAIVQESFGPLIVVFFQLLWLVMLVKLDNIWAEYDMRQKNLEIERDLNEEWRRAHINLELDEEKGIANVHAEEDVDR